MSLAEESVEILSRSIQAPIHSDSLILDNVLERNVKTTWAGGTECKTALLFKFHVRLNFTALITFTDVVCYWTRNKVRRAHITRLSVVCISCFNVIQCCMRMFKTVLSEDVKFNEHSINLSQKKPINIIYEHQLLPLHIVVMYIIYNKPTRCNSGIIVFINNYKYALHVSDAPCLHHQEHYKL